MDPRHGIWQVWAHLFVQPSLALASCGRLWPATAGCGATELGYVRPDLAWCGRPCTFALMQPYKVPLFIVIPKLV
jgi:hypothetical protein